ncbi:uncharacterized protein mah [Prorops nasuta]|uniref:uncharacterized protein mah n=1 Tax=Prorops nasuta TaxID=863751 RepID=UPI0034CDAC75
MRRESTSLLHEVSSGLSVFFATLCIVDIFGVFPIIALPRAVVQCGFLGIPLVLTVFGLQIYTAALLGESWIIAADLDPQLLSKNRYPLAAVTEMTLGPIARCIVTVLLDLTTFGGGIPNLLVASQNLQLFGYKISNEEFNLSYCYWLLLVSVLLCPFMWLGSPRDMKWLAVCSTISVILTAVLIWWCICTDERKLDVTRVPTSPSWDKFISGYGMLAFQFDVHPTLMTIQVDMRHPKSIKKAVGLAFLASGCLFGVTAGLAVWKYEGSTTANILQIVPTGFAVHTAILLAALQLCFSSAIGHSALFQHLEDQFHVQRSFGWKRCTIRSAVVFLGVMVGESVPRFDIVMSLIGGTLTGPLVFVLPPLMYARAQALKDNSNRLSMPNIYSKTTQLHSGSIGISKNSKIHSTSIHYGFKDLVSAELSKQQHSCSRVYYNGFYPDECFIDNSNQLEVGKEVSRDSPIIIDAADPSNNGQNMIEFPSKTRLLNDLRQKMNWFGYLIVLTGITITISSTYINMRNTIRFVKFTPPCIVNATSTS